LSHRFTIESKPAASKSFDCSLSHFRTSSGICDFRTSVREFLDPVVNRFKQQTLPTVNTKHFFMSIICIETFCPQNTHSRTLLFSSILLKHGRHFDYRNRPLNMRMRACYLDYHEAGQCCYLVTHIENLLRPLQLFYFHLWPIF
jgi:hypothetical protein